MGILGDRTGITRQTPVPTNDMTMSSNIDQITSESTGTFIVAATGAADVGSAAGTIVLFGVDKAPIYNASGTAVGTNQDTSFSFDATDTFDAEIAFDYNKYYQYVGGQTQVSMAAAMDDAFTTDGQYMVNYETGLVIGRKKDTDTTETVTYKTRALQIETTTGSTFDLTKIGGTAAVTAPQAYGIDVTGADSYTTIVTANAVRHHMSVSLQGSNDAIVSIDGTIDGFYIPAGSSHVFDGLLIASSATVKGKNASAGNNYTNLAITIW